MHRMEPDMRPDDVEGSWIVCRRPKATSGRGIGLMPQRESGLARLAGIGLNDGVRALTRSEAVSCGGPRCLRDSLARPSEPPDDPGAGTGQEIRMGRIAVVVLSVLAATLGITAGAQAAVLRVAATGVGAGAQINPPGVLRGCTSSYCVYRFRTGSSVTLAAASSDPAGAFVGWQGGCTGAAPRCTVVIDAGKTVLARFTPVRVFTDRQIGGGGVAVTPPGTPCGRRCQMYPSNTALTFTATPAAGWVFSRWHGVCATISTANVCRPTLLGDAEALPEFDCAPDAVDCGQGRAASPRVRTTISTAGPGYVTVNGRRCPPRCSFLHHRGQVLSLRAYRLGSRFVGWTGRGCSGTALRCQLSAIRSVAGLPPAVIARFE
jgi:hypothetical protein